MFRGYVWFVLSGIVASYKAGVFMLALPLESSRHAETPQLL